jgi:hypothetical protein
VKAGVVVAVGSIRVEQYWVAKKRFQGEVDTVESDLIGARESNKVEPVRCSSSPDENQLVKTTSGKKGGVNKKQDSNR